MPQRHTTWTQRMTFGSHYSLLLHGFWNQTQVVKHGVPFQCLDINNNFRSSEVEWYLEIWGQPGPYSMKPCLKKVPTFFLDFWMAGWCGGLHLWSQHFRRQGHRGMNLCEFKTSLVHTASSRTATATVTQWDLVSYNKENKIFRGQRLAQWQVSP